jgi:hypothetical protein
MRAVDKIAQVREGDSEIASFVSLSGAKLLSFVALPQRPMVAFRVLVGLMPQKPRLEGLRPEAI